MLIINVDIGKLFITGDMDHVHFQELGSIGWKNFCSINILEEFLHKHFTNVKQQKS